MGDSLAQTGSLLSLAGAEAKQARGLGRQKAAITLHFTALGFTASTLLPNRPREYSRGLEG